MSLYICPKCGALSAPESGFCPVCVELTKLVVFDSHWLSQALCPEPPTGFRDKTCRAHATTQTNAFREALTEALVAAEIYTEEHDADPRKALNDLIAWHCAFALNPTVSAGARELIAQAEARVKELEEQRDTWMQRAQNAEQCQLDARSREAVATGLLNEIDDLLRNAGVFPGTISWSLPGEWPYSAAIKERVSWLIDSRAALTRERDLLAGEVRRLEERFESKVYLAAIKQSRPAEVRELIGEGE